MLYANTVVETEDGQWFICRGDLHGLRAGTPEIQPFQSRMQCAANLKNRWHWLRLYHEISSVRRRFSILARRPAYPAPATWCDDMVRAYRTIGMLDRNIMRTLKCPAMTEGESHFAMNPNCTYNSPGNLVFLFETRPGWNQHGGSELFSFDNHDPNGGLVLLNDGTVKFIRTEGELRQLRWK
jgi:hypothetical protein